MKKFIAISVILHLILLSIFIPKDEKKKQEQKTSNIPVKLNNKKGSSKPIKFAEKEGSDICPEYYYGVGYMYNFIGEVIDVSPTGSAAKAGLLVGDIVLSHSFNWDREDSSVEGKTVILTINRDEQIIDLNVVIKKICTEREKDE